MHVAAVGVGVVIAAGDQLADQRDDLQLRRLPVRGAGQHQGHQRLVDQHGVGLVDKRHVGIGRHQVVDVGDQLVAQHVEADLVDRGVGDVALVGGPAFLAGRLRGDPADRQPHRLEQRAHPLRVAAGQVVVDGHDVHVPAGQRVAGGGDRAGERLALTGGHLDHVASQHAQRAQQLNVERPQPRCPLARLAGDRKELRDVFGFGEVLEVEQPGRLAQLLVVEIGGLVVVLRRGGDLRERAALVLFGAGAEQAPKPAAQTAGLGAGGLRHRSTVRGWAFRRERACLCATHRAEAYKRARSPG